MGRWLLPQVPGVGPVGRGGHACVTVGTQVVLFGGSDRAPVTYDDLWVLDTAEGPSQLQWTRITPSYAPGCQIHARSGASLTAIGKLVYLMGGQEPLSEFRFGDLKVLDTTSWTWSDVQVQSTSPPARHSHTTTCLAGQCLLVYGGSGYSGTLADMWIFNPAQGAWTQPLVSGKAPPGREMHCAAMVGSHRMLVYGGRAADGSVLCDSALLDARDMKWLTMEPTPFPRCAHCCAALPLPAAHATATGGQAGGAVSHSEQAGAPAGPSPMQQGEAQPQPQAAGDGGPAGGAPEVDAYVLVYGGFSGEAVEGDVLRLDGQTLEVELLHIGPRKSDVAGSVPPPRFAAAAASLPHWPGGPALCVIGGVTPEQDLSDVVIWAEGEPASGAL